MNHRPSGGTIGRGRPMSIARQETFLRVAGVSSSGVPRIAATMFTELTFIEAKTTVTNVSTTPRQKLTTSERVVTREVMKLKSSPEGRGFEPRLPLQIRFP
jgi:hypothetical protein